MRTKSIKASKRHSFWPNALMMVFHEIISQSSNDSNKALEPPVLPNFEYIAIKELLGIGHGNGRLLIPKFNSLGVNLPPKIEVLEARGGLEDGRESELVGRDISESHHVCVGGNGVPKKVCPG
ncbi:hypothetical protein NL676_005206 [Syzygium grande]|nr:hypothetical protein NL676_005206 [Syzygium grande]